MGHTLQHHTLLAAMPFGLLSPTQLNPGHQRCQVLHWTPSKTTKLRGSGYHWVEDVWHQHVNLCKHNCTIFQSCTALPITCNDAMMLLNTKTKKVVITITHAVDMANINTNQHLSQHSTVHIGLDGQPVHCQESCLAYDYNYTSGGICTINIPYNWGTFAC